MNSFFKGIARAFTIPRADRKKIDNSPAIQAVLPFILSEAGTVISQGVDKNISDPAANAAVKSAIASLLSHVIK